MSLGFLLLMVPVTMWAMPAPGMPANLDFRSLQQLDALSSFQIQSLGDARVYVNKAAALCGVLNVPLVRELESRLVAGEFDVANDPNRLVSDHQIAVAFNDLSDELEIDHPSVLTASDILQYRSVMAAVFPHLFSPKSVSGSRPVGAIVLLYQLWYNGGITIGVRKAALLDRPAGSLKMAGGQITGHAGANDANSIGTKYRTAGNAYFAGRPPQQAKHFLDRLAGLIGLPERGDL